MELLIYGYGKRVLKHILPAAKKVFNKIYISGRNEKKIKEIANSFSCEAVKESEYQSLKNLSHIYIGTPEHVFIPSIEKLKNFFNKDINLFLETPILGPVSNYKILKYKKYFNKILVAEDYIFSPIFDCLKELKKNLNIEKIINTDFINSGYHLHSLAFGFKLSKSKKIFVSNKYNKNYYFKFYDQKVNILNKENLEKTIVFNTLKEKITFFHLKEFGKINVEIENKSSENKIFFSFNFNKLSLNVKNKDDLFRIYSCINMFKKHETENLSSIDHNIYISLIVKFVTKYSFFSDLYFYRRSLLNSFFKFIN